MSPRTRAAIFIALALVAFGLAGVTLASGAAWYVAAVDALLGCVLTAFAYRQTHPRKASNEPIKPLRAPRPPR